MDRQVYQQMQALEREHWWFAARRQILSSQIERLNLAPDARILEVGCGTGGNLDMLSGFGRVTGVEPDGEARAYAAERSCAVVLPGGLPGALPDLTPNFDLVAALDVIEHVDEDAASLAALGALLKPGGRLLATVPAYGWMWSAHDERHHHKRRYTLGAFSGLVRQAGLKVRKASYFNALLFPAIGAVRLLGALTGRKADDEAMPSPVVNRGLRALFAAERGLLGRFSLPFGVSILVIAERPA